MRRRYGKSRKERYFVSFAVGLLTCFVLPAKAVIILLGVALVVCGLSGGNRC